jgi:hypothetical protein
LRQRGGNIQQELLSGVLFLRQVALAGSAKKWGCFSGVLLLFRGAGFGFPQRGFSLLPDGQITQKRPQQIVRGWKKFEAGKWQNLAKSGRKEAGKYFYNYLDEKPYNNL